MYMVHIQENFFCLDLGPTSKLSHYVYANIPKSEKANMWNTANTKYFK
jgi:hypothetical protein